MTRLPIDVERARTGQFLASVFDGNAFGEGETISDALHALATYLEEADKRNPRFISECLRAEEEIARERMEEEEFDSYSEPEPDLSERLAQAEERIFILESALGVKNCRPRFRADSMATAIK